MMLLIWLLLAGPVWAAVGGYFVPRFYGGRLPGVQSRLWGMLSGFTLGPLAVGYTAYRQRRITAVAWTLMSVAAVAMTVVMVGQMTAHAAVIGWFVLAGPVWAIIGSQAIPRRYRRMGFDDSQAHMLGLMTGLVTGPLGLALLWFELPAVNRNWSIVLTALAIWQLYTIFALLNPSNPCVGGRSVTYITQQTLNGLIIGVIYALMSVGLTLIYSVQRVVSFAHGQFYMVGGYFSYYFLFYVSDWVTQATGTEFTVNPIWGIPIAGALTFLIGVLFELLFLRPMHSGQIERAGEYAILITFGFGFFLEYTTLAAVGPFPVRTGKFSDVKRLTFGEFVVDSETLFGPVRLLGDRVFATVIGIVLIGFLLWFLQRTWTGRGLRAVSMDKQAAAVTGVNPLRMNTFAFGLGTMLAGMSGAALIPIFAWVPWVGAEMATRSYVVVVLGGLGSVPGALLGGLIVGVVEALGAGCYPDPSKGAAYKEAFALLIFALVLLLRPTGLFGRKEL